MPLNVCTQILQKENPYIKLQMYSNVFCALNCISKSPKKKKTSGFHAEAGNKRVFKSGCHEILIGDIMLIYSVVF